MDDYLKQISSTHPEHLKVAHINAQSLCETAHYVEFCLDFANSGFDIIAVSETFFKNSSQKCLPNYIDFTVDRVCDRASGGVALYIKDCHKTKVLSSSNGDRSKPEYIIVEVLINTVKILCVCIYRPPHIGYMEDFLNDVQCHLPNYKYSIVCGDVNARFGSGSSETKNIEEIFQSCNLTFLPFGPTYHTSQCQSFLDIIASNCNDLVIDFNQIEAPGFSAHDLLWAVFNISTPKFVKKTVTYRNYKQLNIDSLLDDANMMPWENIFSLSNINEKVSLFNSLLIELFDKHAPLKTVKLKEYDEPWMTKELKKERKKRDKLWKKFKISGSPEVFENYRQFRNKLKQKMRNAKVKYFNDLFNTSDSPKFIWSHIKSLGIGNQRKESVPVVPVDNLVNHYADVSSVKFPDLVEDSIAKYSHPNSNGREEFHFKYVFPNDIIDAISSVKSKAKGVDQVPVSFLNLCLPILLPILVHLLNYSLQNGVFPDQWKRANILPIPKLKIPMVCKDYRPVSILCVLAKVLEKIVHKQVVEYVDKYNILSIYQSGFRKGHSTITALLKVTDDIRKAMDKSNLTILALLDLSKAFDCVHHELLLNKLRFNGFSTSTIKWFKSYLCDRFIRVFVNDNIFSDWVRVTTGVPQGSVLGPLLFILYLFDLSSVLTYCSFHLYADDVQLYIHFPLHMVATAVQRLIMDILDLIKYFNSHNLNLNVEKTQAMFIGYCKTLESLSTFQVPPIEIQDKTIVPVKEAKNLGVIFDSTLSWSQQCKAISSNVFGIIAQLRRNMSFIPTHIRKQLIQSLVLSRVDYALPLLTDLSDANLTVLQRVQNAAVRFITYIPRHHHITPLYNSLGIIKIRERITLKTAIMVWNIMKFQSPRYLYDIFHPLSITNKRNTRLYGKALSYPSHRTTKYNKSFVMSACRVYNEFQLFDKLHLSSYTVHRYIHSKFPL